MIRVLPVKNVVLSALVLGLSIVAASCSDTPTSPSVTVPFSKTDIRQGEGASAVVGNVLAVHYTGWLYDASRPDQKGGQFDSSAGFQPFAFTLGAGSVIAGWDQGLQGMQVGGLRRLVIPSSLAYGGTRSSGIPPNATLLFEIELVELVQ